MKKVFCLGESLIDFVAEKQGADLSKATEFTKKAGGAPANVACAIAKLGGKSNFIGCVGKDPFGQFLLQILEDHRVDISLAQRSDVFTTLAFVSLTEEGERDFVFSRGADRELKYDPSIKGNFDGNILHLGAATALLGGNLEEAYGRYLFDALTHDTFISFDPNFRTDLWKANEASFIKKCLPFIEKSHLCKFSKEEAQLLSGKEHLSEACNYFHDLGTEIIVITLGAEGTLVSTPDTEEIVPSIAVTPVDTTGAGDAFIGCLLKQIAALDSTDQLMEDHKCLLDMVKKANIAGAITTTNYGAIASLPTREDVLDVLG
ncbi:carbohydrate kinase family protein [Muriicola sp. Z0-33]|uniref:carbohydrate kinase family protein n=1 Tax=Muriicola sp. Z0-33 TaxID=2816957 RepID=UPI002238043C|nr:carbohydrate kinase [Muriicola sp. Z0-33]MCW5514860.1 carbohydrate kinase [Muriicola sp. Z0-33]